MTARKPVLISGGGLAALLLAHSLKKSNIPFLLFERDASIIFRAQGYRLRLSDVGLEAIESALGPEDFEKFYDACGKTGGAGFAAIDPITGETVSLPQEGPTKEVLDSKNGVIVGIARGQMRKLFMEGCEEHIRWNHRVTGYELTPTGVHAIFADGSKSEEGSLLVAGDGIYSSVSKQLSKGAIKVYDTGARGVHGQAPTSAFKELGEGVFRFTDDNTQPNGGKVFLITNVRAKDMDDPDVQFGWTLGGTPGVIQVPNDDYTIIGKPAAAIAKSLTSHWHPRVKSLFDHMIEDEAAFWKITCSSPDGVPEWPNEPRVTLIGDAVHSMTPAGGNGANTAVRDSALLGKLLAEAAAAGKEDWEGVTAAYEKEMRVYGSAAVEASFAQAKGAFGAEINESTPTI